MLRGASSGMGWCKRRGAQGREVSSQRRNPRWTWMRSCGRSDWQAPAGAYHGAAWTRSTTSSHAGWDDVVDGGLCAAGRHGWARALARRSSRGLWLTPARGRRCSGERSGSLTLPTSGRERGGWWDDRIVASRVEVNRGVKNAKDRYNFDIWSIRPYTKQTPPALSKKYILLPPHHGLEFRHPMRCTSRRVQRSLCRATWMIQLGELLNLLPKS
jgi:hypothetical protein